MKVHVIRIEFLRGKHAVVWYMALKFYNYLEVAHHVSLCSLYTSKENLLCVVIYKSV